MKGKHHWRLSALAGVALFFFVSASSALSAEIDRLVAAVNGQVLTENDLSLARMLNAIILQEEISQPATREEEIRRLVDLELMRQELNNFSTTREEETEIDESLKSLEAAYAGKGGLSPLLCRLGLQEAELASYLRLQSSILKFVDFRFRPFARVTEEEIKGYYETRLTPQLRKAGLELPSLPQVSSRIEEILKEEKINKVLEQWITDIRRNSRIEYFDSAGDLQPAEAESKRP